MTGCNIQLCDWPMWRRLWCERSRRGTVCSRPSSPAPHLEVRVMLKMLKGVAPHEQSLHKHCTAVTIPAGQLAVV